MRKKIKSLMALLLALVMLTLALCSCGGDSPSSEPESSSSVVQDDDSNNDNLPSDSSSTSTSANTTSVSSVATTSGKSTAKTTTSKTTAKTTGVSKDKAVTLNVKDFGAKGDGKTDDATAIFNAMNALRTSPEGSVLEFEKGKTYYYKDNGVADVLPYLFHFSGDKNLTVKGNGCLVKLGGYKTVYLKMEDCQNITIEGFNLDYEIKPAFAAELISIDASTGVALVKADRSINLQNGEEYTFARRESYATMPTPTSHYYFWIKKYEMVDNATHTVRVYFNTTKGNTGCYSDTTLIEKYGLVMPMPYMANGNGDITARSDASFIMNHCTDLTFKNINVYSNKYQTFVPRECEGTLTFDSVNFVRAPYDQDLCFVSWGDIYHPINSGAKFVYKNCKSEYIQDDCFNFLGVAMYVEQQHSSSDITLGQMDTYYGVSPMKAGDKLTIIDKSTGKLIGRPKVRKVIQQSDRSVRITVNQIFPTLNVGKDIVVWNENTVPVVEMTNCDMDGTYRARANATFTNCRFKVRRFYIGLEWISEGPVPHDLLFKNCEFICDPGKVVHIQSYNTSNSKGYHTENIVFENCTGIDESHIETHKFDEYTIR